MQKGQKPCMTFLDSDITEKDAIASYIVFSLWKDSKNKDHNINLTALS